MSKDTIQLLGMCGAVGGASYCLSGLRMLVLGSGEDPMTTLLGLVWALCWVAAGYALLQLRVNGSTRLGRAFSVLLIAGFSLAALWACHRLIDINAADRGPFAVAPMVVILGMVGTGIMGFRRAPWTGWRRALPLGIALVYVVTVSVSIARGVSTLPYAFTLAGLGYLLLGDTIRRQGHTAADANVAVGLT